MGILVHDLATDRVIEAETVKIVDALLEAKWKKPFWAVVEAVIGYWATKEPKAYRSYIVNLNSIKETRKDRYATSGKKDYNQLRYLIDVPEFVVLILRKLYDTSELDMDKKFWTDFGKHFPLFKVPEKS